MARTEYSDEVKAQVMAALLAGQSVSSAARQYKIPKGTLVHWRDAAHAAAIETVRDDSTQKRPAIDDLLRNYLDENLVTLREQAIFFRDTQWLSGQSASELAVLHGVIADKTIRILEAWGNAGGNEAGD